MPFQSIYPLVASVGLIITSIGVAVISHAPDAGTFTETLGELVGGNGQLRLYVSIAGLLVVIAGIFMWAHEGNEGYHLHPETEETHS